jgi:hypothetical protein
LKSLSAAIALPPPSGMANNGAVASNARRLMRKGTIDMPPLLLFPRSLITTKKVNFSIIHNDKRRGSHKDIAGT